MTARSSTLRRRGFEEGMGRSVDRWEGFCQPLWRGVCNGVQGIGDRAYERSEMHMEGGVQHAFFLALWADFGGWGWGYDTGIE